MQEVHLKQRNDWQFSRTTKNRNRKFCEGNDVGQITESIIKNFQFQLRRKTVSTVNIFAKLGFLVTP